MDISACHLTSGSASKVPLLFLPGMFSVPVAIRAMLEDGTMEVPSSSSGLQPTPGRCHAQVAGRAEKSSGSTVWHQDRTHRVRGHCGNMSAWLDPPTSNEVVAVSPSASRLKTHRRGLACGGLVQRSYLPMKAECDCEPERCDDSNTVGTGLPVSFSEVDATASAAFLEPRDAATFPLDSRSQGGIPGKR